MGLRRSYLHPRYAYRYVATVITRITEAGFSIGSVAIRRLSLSTSRRERFQPNSRSVAY